MGADFRLHDSVSWGNQSAVRGASRAACLLQNIQTERSCLVLICSLVRIDETPTGGFDW